MKVKPEWIFLPPDSLTILHVLNKLYAIFDLMPNGFLRLFAASTSIPFDHGVDHID